MKFSRSIIFLLALLSGLGVSGLAHAQEQRWLVIFDTSSAMKKRLPAVEAEIKTLLATGFGGKISVGDSLGVWTLGDKLKVGQFSLTDWSPETVPALVTNLISFVRAQNFSGSADLAALQPLLGRLVPDSQRLTVLIFCDGTEQINWSPYDDGINSTLRQTAAERKKSQQPVLVVLRSQQGKFIGGTVNFPPVPVSLPAFPLLPDEMKPVAPVVQVVATNPPPVTPAPPKTSPPVLPSLIITGTHVSSNADDLAKPAPVVSKSIPPPILKTNPPPATETNKAVTATSPAVSPPPAVAPNLVTTQVSTSPTVAAADDHLEKYLTVGGAGLLVLAAGLVIFLMRRKNAPRGSLITSSMQESFRPPGEK